MSIPSVVNPTLLYNNLRDVIPAPYQVRGKLQWESRLPPAQREKTGFRIKSGMTKCVKSFMKHYTTIKRFKFAPSIKKF